jgi:8-oxo-dGTP diphosphatase
VLSLGLLVELDEVEQDVAHRAARLYRFDEHRYKKLLKRGFNFEI